MTWVSVLTGAFLVLEYVLKVLAVGTVPENRRPSSSSAWLLLILFVPVLGFVLYWLIGSPWVRGRRVEIQSAANELLRERMSRFSAWRPDQVAAPGLASVLAMNERLTSIPCLTGAEEGLYGETADFFAAMTEAVAASESHVHVEFYIVSWDPSTDSFFSALVDAAARGVRVRLLLDHLGSRTYPGRKEMFRRMSEAGIDWHLMMPIDPLRGRWRRPDLRNHRKLLVVDGEVAFLGSHNLIDPSYGSDANKRDGRLWKDLSLRVSGDIVLSVQAVFLTDWHTETGEVLDLGTYFVDKPDLVPGGRANGMQLVPSGPGFPTEPNLRMFTSLVHLATERISITSPYFVPDDALLAAITSAAYRGVEVELFVGEKADQFLVGHAQRSYYSALLDAGVVIHLYPAPTVLHAKYMTIDGTAGVIGSSNMDFRSFGLTYEVMLLAFGGDLVTHLQRNDEEYRAASRVLGQAEWRSRPWHQRYIDNVCRLTAALM
ncbi:cardiolipin synthase [Nocardioides marinisabuli]|uniref:Cardiolipin synthase n=1 Tax=Nocardioides marinisabuli TaxID=419476 RepID=A0A7Y9JPU0_9ACTN|nr:cardiolipin synthase [Nocardioides marinisabuli]NYD57397.1 cardiolipin synthase [Nocardioides marinisabuli]